MSIIIIFSFHPEVKQGGSVVAAFQRSMFTLCREKDEKNLCNFCKRLGKMFVSNLGFLEPAIKKSCWGNMLRCRVFYIQLIYEPEQIEI